MVISRFIILIVISMLFSAKEYNVVVNNDLDLMEDFTFQDFFDLQDKGPGLFDVSDYTFEELIDELPTYEELFLANCQNISNNLNEQLSQKFSMMVSSTNIEAGTQSKFYWVKSDDRQLFKGIDLSD